MDSASGRVNEGADGADILIFGTGSFAGRIVFDLAATAASPVRVAVAGRNTARLDWLRTAANARAVIFGRPAHFITEVVDLSSAQAAADVLGRCRPRVVLQAASAQTSAVISSHGDAWSRLVAEGGLSATAIFQAMLSLRALQAIRAVGIECHFVNACFPDVVNALLVARGYAVDCGVGNVGILANAFAGKAGLREPGALRVIAHYQTIGAFRRPPRERNGPWPRVWIGDAEITDVPARFRDVQLTPEPAIEISGAAGVPLLLAMAAGREWRGHVPGPNGLIGGYPVVFQDGRITLDLPAPLSFEEAVAWNRQFEENNGLVIEPAGQIRYCGVLRERLAEASPELARGFAVTEIEEVYEAMLALRDRLRKQGEGSALDPLGAAAPRPLD